MIRAFALLSLGLCLVGCGSSASNSDLLSEAATLAATCSGCHGSENVQAIVTLDGYSSDALRTSLLNYQSGDGNTAMHRIARGYSADEIEQIANYLGADGDGS